MVSTLIAAAVVGQSAQTAAPSYFHLLQNVSQPLAWRGSNFGVFNSTEWVFLGGGDPLTTRVVKDGQVIGEDTFTSRFERRAPVAEVGGIMGVSPYESGSYEIQWFDGEQMLYRFPFQVEAFSGGDPFDPTEGFYLNGPWDDFVMMRMRRSQGGFADFVVFCRLPKGQEDDGTEWTATIEITKDGVPFAVFPQRDRERLQGLAIEAWWTPLSFMLYDTNEELAEPRQASDFTDGQYEITWAVHEAGDRSNVNSSGVNAFEVSGGSAVPVGRQAPGAKQDVRIEGFFGDHDSIYYFIPHDLEAENELAGIEG